MSGVLKNDAHLSNFNRGTEERLQHVQVMQGKTATAVNDLQAGDIGAVAKLKDTLTADTLGDKNGAIFYPPARLPEPLITFAIEPKTRADEDKIGTAIHRILEEDPALRFSRDPQTKEFLLAGSGQQHIEVVVAKLRKRYHVELDAEAAQGSLPRNDSRQSRRRRKTQEANRRPRPVRRLPHQARAACRAARESSSWTIFSVARFRRTGFRRSKKEFAIPPNADSSPVFRWWISARAFTTANITTSIHPTWHSKSPARWLSKSA